MQRIYIDDFFILFFSFAISISYSSCATVEPSNLIVSNLNVAARRKRKEQKRTKFDRCENIMSSCKYSSSQPELARIENVILQSSFDVTMSLFQINLKYFKHYKR